MKIAHVLEYLHLPGKRCGRVIGLLRHGERLHGAPPLATIARRSNDLPATKERPPVSETPQAASATIADFDRLEVRVGVIVDAQPFPQARKPAYKLWIDFGAPLGIKRSSAQVTVHYAADQLIGRQVMAVTNFPPRQIGPFVSEVLTLGVPDEAGAVVLLRPDLQVPIGGRMF